MPNTETVTIYTDGGCSPNPGTGGWAAVMLYGHIRKELSGGEHDTTNNRMELTAAIESLTTLKRPCKVHLITDSQYLKNGVQQWMPQWKAKNWKRKTGPIKNLELWKQLDILNQKHQIKWDWVRAHLGVPENERCDTLATQQIALLNQTG